MTKILRNLWNSTLKWQNSKNQMTKIWDERNARVQKLVKIWYCQWSLNLLLNTKIYFSSWFITNSIFQLYLQLRLSFSNKLLYRAGPEFQILIGIYSTYDLYDEGLNQIFKHFQGTSSSSSRQPPYSPRSSLLSPVKFGDQLQPQLKAVQPPSGSSYTSYRLPSYSRDNLIEKLRQVRICN